MTTIALTEMSRGRRMAHLTFTVPAFLWAFIRRRQERRLFARLSRLPPHLIRDAGFEPEAVYEAVRNSWDEVSPGRFHPFLRESA